MSGRTLTDHDKAHCIETWEQLQREESLPDEDLALYTNDPETVMLSTGYADVWADGDVNQHGRVVFNCND